MPDTRLPPQTDLVSLAPNKSPIRTPVAAHSPARWQRHRTEYTTRAATTIQRFYTHKLASNVSRFGLVCKGIAPLSLDQVIATVDNPIVMKTMKLLLLRFLALTEHGSVFDDSVYAIKRAIDIRCFTRAYAAAYNGPFMAYHTRIGNTFSHNLADTAKAMLDTFETLRMSIVSAPRGADHVKFVEEALSLHLMVRAYMSAFNEWDVWDQKRAVSVCKDKLAKLHELEDGFVTAKTVTRRVLQSLDNRKTAVRERMFNISAGAGTAALKEIDRSRLGDKLAQIAHELLVNPSADIDTHRFKFASTEQHKIGNLVLHVAKKGWMYEREYMDEEFATGKRVLVNAYEWYVTILKKSHGYTPNLQKGVEAEKLFLTQVVDEATKERVDRVSKLAFVVFSTQPVLPPPSDFPETYAMDTERIIAIHKSFYFQKLVVEIVKFTVLILKPIQKNSFDRFDIVDTIAKEIIFKDVGPYDIEQLVTIVFNATTAKCFVYDTYRDSLCESITLLLDDKVEVVGGTAHTLRKVLHESIDYDNGFKTVAATVASFKHFNLPIGATALAPILHKQGLEAHKIVHLNLEVHAKRYASLMQHASISTLYGYP